MKSKILNNSLSKERYGLLELALPKGIPSAQPGQFLHVRIEDSCDPLLRRPFSIHDIRVSRRKGRAAGVVVRILYEVVGKGTFLLSQKKAGDLLDAIGPLGEGFVLAGAGSLKEAFLVAGRQKFGEPRPPSKLGEPRRVCGRNILVAGGMGVAPLFFLAKKLVHHPQSAAHRRPLVLIGVKTKSHILCEKEFKKLGCEVRVSTEDGSRGFKGRVTDLLEERLPLTIDHRRSAIFACGPKAMLAQVSRCALRRKIPAQVSLEEFMGCGLGACLGCVIKARSGYRRICHDGPVFDAKEILWDD